MQGANQRIVIHPHEGEAVALGGVGVVYKVAGDDTGGRLAIVEHPVEPGTLVPPPTHTPVRPASRPAAMPETEASALRPQPPLSQPGQSILPIRPLHAGP